MNKTVQEKLTAFTANYHSIKDGFIWQEAMAKRLAALVCTMAGQQIDLAAIKDCHSLIKSETGIFSSFRGNLSIYMAAALSLHPQPSALLADVMRVYDLLKQQGFWGGDFLAAAAYEIAVGSGKGGHEKTAQRTRAFYDEMKANHRFHIGSGDYIFAAMLALSDIDPHAGALKMKNLFRQLKSEFSIFVGAKSVLHLAQMLVLGGSTDECVQRLLKLNRSLRKQKIRLDKAYTLPSLGVLGILDAEPGELTENLASARDYLRGQKGFGSFSVMNAEILLYAAAFTAGAYAEGSSGIVKANAATSVTNMIIAQQVAVIVSVSAATGAAAGSSC